jgi:hypothetical protein
MELEGSRVNWRIREVNSMHKTPEKSKPLAETVWETMVEDLRNGRELDDVTIARLLSATSNLGSLTRAGLRLLLCEKVVGGSDEA